MKRLAVWAQVVFVVMTAALMAFATFMLWNVVTGHPGLSGGNMLAVMFAAYAGVGVVASWRRHHEP